jgi:glycosyltransferase involved in cell wall biosynthesis
MVRKFSRRLEVALYTPRYPSTHADPVAAPETLRQKLLGDRDLLGVLRECDPDVVFTDSPLYAAHVELQQIRLRRRTPILVHLLGDWWSEYWSWFLQTSWRRRLMGTQQFLYSWGGLGVARQILPVCNWLETVTNHYLPTKRTKVVEMGVDPEEFRSLRGMRFKKPAVAIIQNHTVAQKVRGLLKFKHVTDQLPSVNFYMAEGQSVEQRYLAEVKSTFAASPNVHFVSEVNTTKRVRMMLTASDCYVLASGLDCFPVTILEASLMGKPIVASRVGGVPETLVEGKTGWTIPNDSTSQWINRINQLLADRTLSERFGREGRKWVTKNFAWSVIARKVEDLILRETEPH